MSSLIDNRFIVRAEFNRWFDQPQTVFHCAFNSDGYNDQLFHQLDIEFPASLHRAVTKRRAEYLAGRYCAKRSLEQFGVFDTQITIGKHRNPVWPESVIGSISHCNGLAVAAIDNRTSIKGIGIDIEDVVKRETLETIQHQIVSPPELALISSDAEKRAQLFTVMFSVKESFFKAAYPAVGRYFGFDAVAVVRFDYAQRSVLLKINHNLCDGLEAGQEITGYFRLLDDRQIVTLVTL